jgi:hypothetical protein
MCTVALSIHRDSMFVCLYSLEKRNRRERICHHTTVAWMNNRIKRKAPWIWHIYTREWNTCGRDSLEENRLPTLSIIFLLFISITLNHLSISIDTHDILVSYLFKLKHLRRLTNYRHIYIILINTSN